MQEAQKKEKEFDMAVEATTLNKIDKPNEEDLRYQGCVSHWLQFVWETEVMPKDLANSVFGDEFTCVQN